MDDKYLSEELREEYRKAQIEAAPKPPRIPVKGKQMRKLWRGIARDNMASRGLKRINKKRGKAKKSIFAENWLNFC